MSRLVNTALAAVLLTVNVAVAQQSPQTRPPSLPRPAARSAGGAPNDLPGSADPPGFKRYEGSTIVSYQASAYDEFTFPLSRVEFGDVLGGARPQVDRSKHVEGRYTRIAYREPEGRSPLEVFRNYQAEVKDAGGEVLWECAGAECDHAYGNRPNGAWLVKRYLINDAHSVRNQLSTFNFPEDCRYFVGRIPGTGSAGDTYVSAFIDVETFDSGPNSNKGRTMALMDVVQEAAMQRNMVTISAERMAGDIGAQGRVALYGILFDFDRAEVKPESDPTLSEIAKLLTADPRLKLLVVGHTDNAGGFDYNLDLSQRRAAAVARVLGERYRVEASRLRAGGVGMMAPVASNDDEAGRAKNRRVELVKQ